MDAETLRRHARFAGAADRARMLAEADRLEGLKSSERFQGPSVPKWAEGLDRKDHAKGWTAQCPACAEDDRDTVGKNHLLIFEDGGFACILHPAGGDDDARREHRQRVEQLLGIRRHGGKVVPRANFREEKTVVKTAAQALWEIIQASLSGPVEALGESAEIPDAAGQFCILCKVMADRGCRRFWCGILQDFPDQFRRGLFDPSDPESVEMAWKTASANWASYDVTQLVEWVEFANSRKDDQVARWLLRVVEHDGSERPGQIALIRYCRDVLHWPLLYVLDTGGKGFHGVFDTAAISADALDEQLSLLESMGADPGPLRKGKTRTPGIRRRLSPKVRKREIQQIVWISPTIFKS